MPIVDPQPQTGPSIAACRAQVAAIIAHAIQTPVRVHAEWKLKLDIGKQTSLLVPENETFIHAWMIGASRINPTTTGDGDFEFVGGKRRDIEIDLSVWGFWDYALKDPVSELASQEIAEKECELLGDYFAVNRNNLGFDLKPPELRKVKPFRVENIDNHDFSDGLSLVVAQCVLPIVLCR